jgi:hypothetical protein
VAASTRKLHRIAEQLGSGRPLQIPGEFIPKPAARSRPTRRAVRFDRPGARPPIWKRYLARADSSVTERKSHAQLMKLIDRLMAETTLASRILRMKIAQIAPLFESVPPRLYGGTERVVSYLTEELVRQGHDVTLLQAEILLPPLS